MRTRMRLHFFALLSCGLMLCTPNASLRAWQLDSEAGSIPYTMFTPEDHFGGTYSVGIAEDSNGNIYVVNEAGILRFDGSNWSELPDSGYTRGFTSIHIDRLERIWVGGTDHIGYYETDSNGRLTYADLTDDLYEVLNGHEFGMIWNIFSDKERFYIVTSFHVLIWDETNWHRIDFRNISRRILPTWLDGRLYIHARGDALYRITGRTKERIFDETEELSSGVMSVLSAEQGQMRLATLTNGIWLREGEALRKVSESPSPNQIAFSHLKIDENRLIIGQTDGLYLYHQDGRSKQIGKDSIDMAHRLFRSSDGSVWVTSDKITARVPPSIYTSYGGGADRLERHAGKIYLNRGSKMEVLSTAQDAEEIANGWISNPLSVGKHLIYAEENALYSISNGELNTSAPIERPISVLRKSVWNENIFYSVDEPELSRWEVGKESVSRLTQTNDSKRLFVTLAEADQDTTLYTTYSSEIGLVHWPKDGDTQKSPTIEVLTDHPSLPQDILYAKALQLGKGAVLATEKGIFSFEPKTNNFIRIDELRGQSGKLWSDFVHSLDSLNGATAIYIKDRDHPAGYRLGLLHDNAGNGFSWQPLNLPGISALGTVRTLLYEEQRGRKMLWVGGTKDLFRYDITELETPPLLNVNISSIAETTEGRLHYGGFGPLPNEPEWSYPQKSLRISYAAPTATLEIKGYQTRLEGFSSDWSELTEISFREFGNLHEGNYTFEVRAIDEFGRAGPASSYAFTILPPWFRTPYAYLGYVLIFFCVFLLIARLWTNHLRQRNLELEAIVNQRTGELERSNLQLREANAIKQDFLASMSHEIRNPLNGILGIAELFKVENTGDPTRVNHLNACATHLHQLLGQVLDFASLESGKLETRPVQFNASELIDDAVGMHLVLAEKKNINLLKKVEPIENLWIGDPVLLKQVLLNLISNAVKYTPSGEVRILLQYTEENARVSAQFIVEDTGPGIPEDKRDYIFKDFTRLTKAGESEIAGTGLGLAIASEMAELMRGRLRLDPEYNDGARFVLELPFETSAPLAANEARDEAFPETPLLNKRVLAADDMDFNRYITRQLLEKMGAHVVEVEDGNDALSTLRGERFDIAILDINMPGKTGIEVVGDFLSTNTDKPPIFIALTAHVTKKMEQAAQGAGFKHFIEKPLNPAQLARITQKEVEHKRPDRGKDLLSYLSEGDESSRARIERRYQKAMKEQASELLGAIENRDLSIAREILHKLRGLTNLHRNKDVIDSISELSASLKIEAPTPELTQKAQHLLRLVESTD